VCRYITAPYKTHFVCIDCRWVAKHHEGTDPACPKCREPMWRAGRDFHAPRKRNHAAWAAVALVAASGKRYDSCGCDGPGYRPRTKAQARQDAMERPWRPRGLKRA